MAELNVEVKNRVGILTLNRPDKLNALTRDMGRTAVATLREMAEDPDIGAIVLTSYEQSLFVLDGHKSRTVAFWGDILIALYVCSGQQQKR